MLFFCFGRVKKQIDYSKFSGVDSENDFAEDGKPQITVSI